MLLHEDYPHSVPTRAWLRWKENYFWVFMDPASDVFCFAHTTIEPTYERAFASFTVLHDGEKLVSSGEVAMPTPFEQARQLQLGNLRLSFIKPQKEFRVEFEDENVAATLDFSSRMHLFDFLACEDVNPDQFSISDNTGFGRGNFRHQGQCMNASGSIAFKSGPKAGTTIAVNGSGYRDHSWGMRNDQLTLDHNWSFCNFPSMGFHLFQVRNTVRPMNQTSEGYIARPEGNEVIKTLVIENVGEGKNEMPAEVIFRATTLGGETFTIIADLANAWASLPLHSQKPGAKVYVNVENMCRVKCLETGEEGLANVEIGMLRDA